MRDSVVAHESLRRYSKVIPPRVGGGVGGRGEVHVIHASRLTSANHRPVDNAPVAATRDRLGWMGFAEFWGVRP